VNEYPVVVLSCSAGGLPALQTVLAPLPADLPAAVIIVQHMPPDSSSLLPTILGRSTDLTVKWAEEGDSLRAGTALAAPPGQHVLVTKDEIVALIPSGSVPPYRPSADLLLTTLALAAGRRVIAVTLSGHGKDAATGATAVHRFGGTVIACSPETSAWDSMPGATIGRDDITDHVVPLDDMAALLLALTTTPLIEPGGSKAPSTA
jgi:two-component system, chemotaxis family, protein-glutamate methylesterase/glutaminase